MGMVGEMDFRGRVMEVGMNGEEDGNNRIMMMLASLLKVVISSY